jgi:hypothetical protein
MYSDIQAGIPYATHTHIRDVFGANASSTPDHGSPAAANADNVAELSKLADSLSR